MNVTTTTSTLASRIKSERERLNLTQEGLADLVGVHRRTIIRLENGEQLTMNTDLAQRLACAFGCSLDWLIGRYDAEEES